MLVQPFSGDLRSWVDAKLVQRVDEAHDRIGTPRTRETTKERMRENISRFTDQRARLQDIERFRYGVGSDYAAGVLGHADVLAVAPDLLSSKPLLRRLLAQRFPVVLVDESQDTDPTFVGAMRSVAADCDAGFRLGFFGDPMQKIYQQGVGAIDGEGSWKTLKKPENYRCPSSVLTVINRIRADGDGLVQIGGQSTTVDGVDMPLEGTARLIVLPADDQRQRRLDDVRRWLTELDENPVWSEKGDGKGALRVLVLVHRMAAQREGFGNLYAALHDGASDSLKQGLLDGTAWVLRPFLTFILPLAATCRDGNEFETLRLLRRYCPLLESESLGASDVPTLLQRLSASVKALTELLDATGTKTLEIIRFVEREDLLALDERFLPLLELDLDSPPEGETPENAPERFVRCACVELQGYQHYLARFSPFATQQGVKGAEFEHVLVVIDDEESRMNMFSYGKYFGHLPPSATDEKHIAAGEESVIDRTRRLFYVCCSRATHHLAVVVFAADPVGMHAAVLARKIFDTEAVHLDPSCSTDMLASGPRPSS